MDFEHVIIVNDPERSPAPPEPVAALVAALRLLAVRPQVFDEDIDDVELLAERDGTLARKIVRGRLELNDRVALGPGGRSLEQTVEAPDSLAGATRRITIEEPANGVLVLRFRYARRPGAVESELSNAERDVLRAAYLAKDRELVARLRDLSRHGALDTLLALHAPPGWA
jgi:hypothetical protein